MTESCGVVYLVQLLCFRWPRNRLSMLFCLQLAGGRPTGAVRRRRRRRESRIPCDRRERGMFRRATDGSASGGTAPQGKVAGASEKPPNGGFEGLRVQPCFLWFREPPMPGHQSHSRHAEAAPLVAPRRVGANKGRRVRDVRHRCSRRGTGGSRTGFSSPKRAKHKDRNSGQGLALPFMPERGKRRQGNKVASA